MEQEICEAYAGHVDGDTGGLHPESLRDALVQLLNAHVSQATLEACLGRAAQGPLSLPAFSRLYYQVRDVPLDADGNAVVQALPPTTPTAETHPPNAPEWRRGGLQTGPARLQKDAAAAESPYPLGKGAYQRFWQNSEGSPDKRDSRQRRGLKSAPGKQENGPLDFDQMADDEEALMAQGGGLQAVRASMGKR